MTWEEYVQMASLGFGLGFCIGVSTLFVHIIRRSLISVSKCYDN